jgi:hypothetical protein
MDTYGEVMVGNSLGYNDHKHTKGLYIFFSSTFFTIPVQKIPKIRAHHVPPALQFACGLPQQLYSEVLVWCQAIFDLFGVLVHSYPRIEERRILEPNI